MIYWHTRNVGSGDDVFCAQTSESGWGTLRPLEHVDESSTVVHTCVQVTLNEDQSLNDSCFDAVDPFRDLKHKTIPTYTWALDKHYQTLENRLFDARSTSESLDWYIRESGDQVPNIFFIKIDNTSWVSHFDNHSCSNERESNASLGASANCLYLDKAYFPDVSTTSAPASTSTSFNSWTGTSVAESNITVRSLLLLRLQLSLVLLRLRRLYLHPPS